MRSSITLLRVGTLRTCQESFGSCQISIHERTNKIMNVSKLFLGRALLRTVAPLYVNDLWSSLILSRIAIIRYAHWIVHTNTNITARPPIGRTKPKTFEFWSNFGRCFKLLMFRIRRSSVLHRISLARLLPHLLLQQESHALAFQTTHSEWSI